MTDISHSEKRFIYYEFKPIDRRMPTAANVWRTVLDNIGLQHLALPDIHDTIVDWVVVLETDKLEGKEGELEEQLALKVEQNELRYLNISVYKGVNPDGTLCFQWGKNY